MIFIDWIVGRPCDVKSPFSRFGERSGGSYTVWHRLFRESFPAPNPLPPDPFGTQQAAINMIPVQMFNPTGPLSRRLVNCVLVWSLSVCLRSWLLFAFGSHSRGGGKSIKLEENLFFLFVRFVCARKPIPGQLYFYGRL